MKCCFKLSNSLSLRLHTREWEPIKKQEPAEFKQNSNHVTFHLTVVITQLLFCYISRQTMLPANNQVKTLNVQSCKHSPHWESKDLFERSMDLIILKISKVIRFFFYG